MGLPRELLSGAIYFFNNVVGRKMDNEALVLSVAPIELPITVDEVKAHLRITTTDDDDYLDALIAAATTQAESEINGAIAYQKWYLKLDCFRDIIYLPKPPCLSVTSITYDDSDGNSQTLASTVYDVDTDSTRARITIADGQSWPSVDNSTNVIQILFICGYATAAEVPQAIKHAILMIVGSLYENREDTTFGSPSIVPLASKNLLSIYYTRDF